MTVRAQPGERDLRYPPYDEDDEDRLATVIMADRTADGRPVSEMLRPGAAPSHRPSGPPIEAEGVLVEDEDTPNTEQRTWPAHALTPTVHEWEVTEQMPMPSATPPHLQRAVSPPGPSMGSAAFAPPPPAPPTIEHAAIVEPTFDITPEVPRRGREEVAPEWSEVSTPASLNAQPVFDDEESSFVPLIALLAVPAFGVFFAAMWLLG